jgi:serine/threonine protein kinase
MFFSGTSRFKPIRLLGTGGAGSVHLVFDEQVGAEVALKTLNLSSGTDLYRFKREFRALADVKHPNLVTLYELISDGASWFFTMEYVPGLPFDRYLLGRSAPPDGDLGAAATDRMRHEPPVYVDPERLLPSIQQLCAGVHAMHEIGCIHRDLKPTNVLVTEEGRVVILDFGLAQQKGNTTLSGGGVSGTPAYMAPEQALDRPCLPAADWYAVGTMIYEVLTGRCPFEGAMFDVLLRKQTDDPPAPVQVNPEADELLSELCMRLIQRDETRRPTGPEILVRLGVAADQRALPPLRRHTPLGTVALRLPGREHELEALFRAYAKARKGSQSVVMVQGSSGIGKTCLVETFLDDLQSSGTDASAALVLRGRCHERETLPFKALDNVVDGLSHRLASLGAEDQGYVLPDGILYLSEIFPVLRRLKLTEHRRYFLPPLRDAKELRNQAFVAFCELLRRLSRLQPVVIFIDDLQWADRDSFALLRALSQQPGAPSVLLVVAARKVPEGAALEPLLREFEEQPGLETVRLGPLSPESTRALVDNLLDPDEIEPVVRRRIADSAVREAGGNPFFAVELVHHLRTVVLPQGGPEVRLDGSAYRLEGMILDRVGSLPTESQDLLRVIAVAGDPLPQRALAAAAQVSFGSDAWEQGISALLDQCLIRRSGRQGGDLVEPYHDRIRETVVESLDEATLRRVHLGLAHAVEEWERERTDMLARYWLSAEDHERAKRYACEAAAEAHAKLAFDRAAELYETAVSLETDEGARAELLRRVGECQASSGHPMLAAGAYQRAAGLSDAGQAARLHHLAAEQLLRGGHITQGLEILKSVLADTGLRLAPGPGRALVSLTLRILWLRLRGLKFRERPASEISAGDKRQLDVLWSANTGLGVVDTLRADDFLVRFLLLALKTGDIRRVAQGLAVLAGQLAALGGGRFAWATRMVSEAEVLARRSSHAPTIGLARMCKAIVRYFAGEWAAAANDLSAVEQFILTNCHGMGWELATSRSFTCFALRLLGRLRELCERFDRYTADADRAGDRFLTANLRTYLSVVWLIRGDLARAAKGIEGTLDAWPADMYHVQHFFHLYARCEQALYAEDPETAWQAIATEERRLQRSGLLKVSGIRIENAWIRGRVALALAEKAEGVARQPWLDVARASARRLRKAEHQTSVAMGAALDAGVRWLTPGADRGHGLVALERAVATAEASGAALIAESVRRWLGEIIGGRRGEEIRARSNGWMADQGVQDPARLAHLYAPGFRTPAMLARLTGDRRTSQMFMAQTSAASR